MLLFKLNFLQLWASLVAQLVKNPHAMQETWVQSLGAEDPLEKGKASHSSILACRIPQTVHGMAKSWTWLNDFHFHFLLAFDWLYLVAKWSQDLFFFLYAWWWIFTFRFLWIVSLLCIFHIFIHLYFLLNNIVSYFHQIINYFISWVQICCSIHPKRLKF